MKTEYEVRILEINLQEMINKIEGLGANKKRLDFRITMGMSKRRKSNSLEGIIKYGFEYSVFDYIKINVKSL